ncbi:MAG TPA: hypothetical protein VGE38_15965 [Nocardioides sp.]|uniref:hypothetical protein n=1 Tax=Nocardioides sp. TaxID=35761 RepID=UPI002ED9AF9E
MGNRADMRTTAPRVLLALVLLVGPPLLAGCAPGTPDAGAWRADASRATGDVRSEVATVGLALRRHDDLFDSYLQTMVVDAEEAAGAAAEKLSAVQPPTAELERHEEVTSTLDDAASLLSEVRIAVVRHEPLTPYVGRLTATADELDGLEQRLRRPAG